MLKRLLFFAICVLVICGYGSYSLNKYKRNPYLFSSEILSKLAKDTGKQKYQIAAQRLSFIGDYKDALVVWDSGSYTVKFNKDDSLNFTRFKPIDAETYIIGQCIKYRIVIINEAHHHPEHRVFVESLLKGLYKDGFRYLGCETLDAKDTEINTRKYPEINSGYFSVEPQYSNMLRTALDEGFKIFAYDVYAKSIREREMGEAKNIKAVLERDSTARLVIYCGFGHLDKTESPGIGKLMAGWVKEYTGIEPFCIEQTRLTETSSLKYDNPYYKMIDLDYCAVFVDSAGNAFNGPKGYQGDSVRIYHPRTKWIYNRPDWLFKNGRQPHIINGLIPNMGFPNLIFAYYAGEDTDSAVPADVVEMKNNKDTLALALKKGNYIIVVKDINNKRETIKVNF